MLSPRPRTGSPEVWSGCLCEDFVLLVLLCSWLTCAYPTSTPFEILDLFSGKSRIAKLASLAGYSCASYDLCMDDKRRFRYRKKANRGFRSPMDWNGDAGFALHGCAPHLGFQNSCPSNAFIGPSSSKDPSWPRLVVILCIRSSFGSTLAHLGTVCSTWTSVNVATSGRSILCPSGLDSGLARRKGNKMVCRTACVITTRKTPFHTSVAHALEDWSHHDDAFSNVLDFHCREPRVHVDVRLQVHRGDCSAATPLCGEGGPSTL